jgi:hypothetical protein
LGLALPASFNLRLMRDSDTQSPHEHADLRPDDALDTYRNEIVLAPMNPLCSLAMSTIKER